MPLVLKTLKSSLCVLRGGGGQALLRCCRQSVCLSRPVIKSRLHWQPRKYSEKLDQPLKVLRCHTSAIHG